MYRLIICCMLNIYSSFSNAQVNYTIKTGGCQFDMKIFNKKNSKNSSYLEVHLTVANVDSTIKYFPVSSVINEGKAKQILASFSEYFYKNRIIEFFFGTCNEYKFPLYYCKKDSVNFLELLPGKFLAYKYSFNYRWSSPGFLIKDQINFFIRFIKSENVPSDGLSNLGIQEYLKLSQLTLVELNKEKSRDAE